MHWKHDGTIVCMLGGAEALVHWRHTLEEIALSGYIPALFAFDLDLDHVWVSRVALYQRGDEWQRQ